MFYLKYKLFDTHSLAAITCLLLVFHSIPLEAGSTNLAEGRPYTLETVVSEDYPDTANLLTDGRRGVDSDLDCGERLCAPGWVGFDGGVAVITIDLEDVYQVETISVFFLTYPSKSVNPPPGIHLVSSFDGLNWTQRGKLDQASRHFESQDLNWKSRYLRFIVAIDQWAFLDEIRIEGNPQPVEYQQSGEPLRSVLVVTDDPTGNDERQLRLANVLDGIGIDFDVAGTGQFEQSDFGDYQLLIFFSSSTVSPALEQHIVAAIYSGVNVLWVGEGIWGSFKTRMLATAFGVRYVRQDSNESFNVRFAQYKDLDGRLQRLPLRHETMWSVEAVTADVDSWYLDNDGRRLKIPFITRRKRDESSGTALYVAFPLLDRWKADETPFTFARAEILTRAIRSLAKDGLVARHPVAGARDATFMLRLEDYTPGGQLMGHSGRSWMMRMNRLLALTEKYQLPLNIGVIPVYNHTFYGETHDWGEQDQSIIQLKNMAQTAFDRGGSLITHGYDHQNGDALDDYSGDDWETYDEVLQQFLPLDLQQAITDQAAAEIEKHWGFKPLIWETPHYISNDDTFRAAQKSGFKYFTESDTKLFPNWNGYLNNANGLLLNIPETGAFFQNSSKELKEKTLIKQLHILPRIVRMNALFLVFYHNASEQMHHALNNLLMTSEKFDLWKPDMTSFARFWEKRKTVSIDAKIDRKARKLSAVVVNAFDGFTLAIQLPQGVSPDAVLIDGKETAVKQRQLVENWILYPELKDGTHDVVVTYH